MKTLLITLSLTLLSLGSCFSQTTTEYKTTLKKMFEASGSEAMYKSVIDQMFVMFKQNKDIPEEVWSDLYKEFMLTSMDDLVDMLAPVYEKHLTHADLLKLVQFYQTPVGKKYAQQAPAIMQESMQVGQQWGLKIGQQFQEKLKAKGY